MLKSKSDISFELSKLRSGLTSRKYRGKIDFGANLVLNDIKLDQHDVMETPDYLLLSTNKFTVRLDPNINPDKLKKFLDEMHLKCRDNMA